MLDGEIERHGEGAVLRFDRRLDKPIARVWAALVEPARIADWLADAEVDARVGGAYVLRFRHDPSVMTGVITRIEPPRLLEMSWREGGGEPSTLLWELEPDGDGCRLSLTHSFAGTVDLAGFASGWQRHLDGLPGAVDGVRAEWDWDAWRALNAAYQDALSRRASPAAR